MTVHDIGQSILEAISLLQRNIPTLAEKAQQEENCRDMLYINFVYKETYGIQIDKHLADRQTTHQLMIEVLSQLGK